VATSFVVIFLFYAVVFGAGIRYLLGMMAVPPVPGETPPMHDKPIRTGGKTVLTPASLAAGD
jgi:hypothetical protein